MPVHGKSFHFFIVCSCLFHCLINQNQFFSPSPHIRTQSFIRRGKWKTSLGKHDRWFITPLDKSWSISIWQLPSLAVLAPGIRHRKVLSCLGCIGCTNQHEESFNIGQILWCSKLSSRLVVAKPSVACAAFVAPWIYPEAPIRFAPNRNGKPIR